MSKTTEPTPQEPLGDSEGTATSAVVGLESVAFMTHHDEPMLFPTWDEAVQYCDDDESPISLFHADDVAKLQAELAAMTQERDELREWNKAMVVKAASGGVLDGYREMGKQLAAMTKKADGFFDALQLAAKINAEGQAREKQLREALEICQAGMPGDKWDSLYIDGVLAFPQDDTALNTLLAAGQAREQQLREALKALQQGFPQTHQINAVIRHALALPQDDTALRQWGAKLLREVAKGGCTHVHVLRKADELEAGK